MLIDGGTEQDADLIADNIRELGFRPQDIRFILTSHEHFDHVGGVARAAADERRHGGDLGAGGKGDVLGNASIRRSAVRDPQVLSRGRRWADRRATGEEIRLGNMMVTAMTTPGHTAGAMSWRWVSCDGGVCRTVVYADSLQAVGNDDLPVQRSSDPSCAQFRTSIAKIAASPCEILLTPHPSASDMPSRLALGEPLFDPDSCKTYAAKLSDDLDERLAKEKAK